MNFQRLELYSELTNNSNECVSLSLEGQSRTVFDNIRERERTIPRSVVLFCSQVVPFRTFPNPDPL